MPLPLILGIGAAAAALGGIVTGARGVIKMTEAKETMDRAVHRHKKALERFEETNLSANTWMDALGKKEMEILAGFGEFSSVWEKIHNKPEFKALVKGDASVIRYSPEELKNVSIGAGVILGGLGGAAAGTAGGFAAAGATTAAVMALGTASTGTAIASLSGAAATNAVLAALGGGAIAAGGGGIALGTTILGVSTLGVGLLIGGVIFSFAGGKLADKADKAYEQVADAEKVINDICDYLADLKSAARKYLVTLHKVNEKYAESFTALRDTVSGKTDWNEFTAQEKLTAENAALAVGLLYEMCKVKFVIAAENENERNMINYADIEDASDNAEAFLMA